MAAQILRQTITTRIPLFDGLEELFIFKILTPPEINRDDPCI